MINCKKIIPIIGCLLLAACSGTRHLPAGEKLYVGAKIKTESAEKTADRAIKKTAEKALRPQPNTSYFGMRPRLMLYIGVGENPATKLNKWLKKKGEAPVFMSSVKPGATAAIIDAKLFNIGVFNSYTEPEVVERKRTGRVIYTSHIHQPFTIKELINAISDDSISKVISASKEKSLIKAGDKYNLEQIKNERIRIDAFLKNKGYFYFSPDYLLFKADTSSADHSMTLKLTLKDSIPPNALKVYRINNVVVDQNFTLNERHSQMLNDSVLFENIVFMGNKERMKMRPKVISRSVFLRKGEVFSRLNYTKTLNRLMSMGNFKLVQINFSETENPDTDLLDVGILITPLTKYTFRAEMDVVSKSNNYSGPRMNLSILNRNTFKGGELLKLNMAGSYEAQFGGKDKNLYSYSYNPQLELTFPHFIVPFKLKELNSIYISKTSFLLSYNYLKKVNYFDMRTFKFVYGYKWKGNSKQGNELNPIDISYSSIRNQSKEFTDLLDANPFLKKSYEEQFIAGASYSFTYNEQIVIGKKFQSFVHFNTETAGNVLWLASAIGGQSGSADNQAKVAGSVYSQFVKMSIDSRFYYNLPSKNKLALRVFTGLGQPYGNSSVLPYTKQFFSGGPSSIRAFQINSLGPGNYFQDTNRKGFLQMGGDVKLEMNAEYRFTFYKFLKGALFVDAGNVWLLKSNSTTAGTPFSFSGFADQVAVGTGFGLRLDVSFFILRFDLAIPLRKPWIEENNHWVTNQIDFGNAAWRNNNLILNVAIGYPF